MTDYRQGNLKKCMWLTVVVNATVHEAKNAPPILETVHAKKRPANCLPTLQIWFSCTYSGCTATRNTNICHLVKLAQTIEICANWSSTVVSWRPLLFEWLLQNNCISQTSIECFVFSSKFCPPVFTKPFISFKGQIFSSHTVQTSPN